MTAVRSFATRESEVGRAQRPQHRLGFTARVASDHTPNPPGGCHRAAMDPPCSVARSHPHPNARTPRPSAHTARSGRPEQQERNRCQLPSAQH